MNTQNAQERLRSAETRRRDALENFHTVSRVTRFGVIDRVSFETALSVLIEAERELQQARAALANAKERQQREQAIAQDVAQGPEPVAPFEPTPRMRFVRWLVETGRLSDWDAPTRSHPQSQ